MQTQLYARGAKQASKLQHVMRHAQGLRPRLADEMRQFIRLGRQWTDEELGFIDTLEDWFIA